MSEQIERDRLRAVVEAAKAWRRSVDGALVDLPSAQEATAALVRAVNALEVSGDGAASDDDLMQHYMETTARLRAENDRLRAVVEAAKAWRRVADADLNPHASQDEIDGVVDALVDAVDAVAQLDVSGDIG